MPRLNSPLQLPDGKTVLIPHHDGELLAGVAKLSLTARVSVTVHSAAHSCGRSCELSQFEVILQLVEACRPLVVKLTQCMKTDNHA